jgi:hypothetical protein
MFPEIVGAQLVDEFIVAIQTRRGISGPSFLLLRQFRRQLDFRRRHIAFHQLSGAKDDQETGFADAGMNPFSPFQAGQEIIVYEYGVMLFERPDDLIED